MVNSQLYQALLERSFDAIVLINREGTIAYASPATTRILGYAAEDLAGQHFMGLAHPEDGEGMRANFAKLIASPGGTATGEFRLRHKAGTWRWIEVAAVNMLDDSMVGWVAANFRDVSARKPAESRQALLAAIVESSEDAIVSETLDGEITSWNGAAERLFGYSKEEVVGKNASIIVPPGRMAEAAQMLSIIRSGGRVAHHETLRFKKDGALLRVSLSVSPVIGVSGEVMGASEIARDVTEKKRTEAQLRFQVELARRMLANAPCGLVVINSGGVIELANRAFHSMLDIEAKQTKGVPLEDVVKAPALIRFINSSLKNNRRLANIEVSIETKAGAKTLMANVTTFEASADLEEALGANRYAIVSLHDVTSERMAMEHLMRTGTLSALGRMAVGIAHEINNPLAVILGFTELIKRDKSDPNAERWLQEISSNAERAANIVHSLLRLTGSQGGKRIPVDINQMVSILLNLRKGAFERKSIKAAQELCKELPFVTADPLQIQLALTNLIDNAEDALISRKSGRKLWVKTGVFKEWVRVEIKDNGAGIPKGMEKRIFEPFFTTKGSERSVGLGLTISMNIIVEHGGRIFVQLGREKGAHFIVELPVVSGQLEMLGAKDLLPVGLG
ncbi:MAG: PAS domain S-box protein [SAR202 cluster bacterium]|nr:PAS domain S-box protein [SAR202 cluster bacterium]